MKIVSVNVGRPRLVLWKGSPVSTAIFKSPVEGLIEVKSLNLCGDRQADLSVHGGPYKAVYGYPSEHYDYWREKLPGMDLSWGIFGENFTTEGMREEDLHVGDRLRIGSATLMVRQLRMPCYKLAAKFQRDDMIDRFLDSGHSGFYFSVEQEGEVEVGDSFELLSRNHNGITIAEMNRVIVRDRYNRDLLLKAIATPALPEAWREYFLPRLKELTIHG